MADFGIQRPGYEILPPAIARHLVFRLSMGENPRFKERKKDASAEDKDELWRALCGCLTGHIKALRGAYRSSTNIQIVAPHRESDVDALRYSTRRSCIVPINGDGSAQGYRLRVRVDVHTELFSLTYIFDRIDTARRGILSRQIARLPGDPEVIDWLLNGLWGEKSDPARKEEPEAPRTQLPAAKILHPWLRKAGAAGSPKRLGTLITDFRGIIICPRDGWDVAEPSLDRETVRKPPWPRPRLDKVLAEFVEAHEPLVRRVASPGGVDLQRTAGPDSRAANPGCDAGGEAVVCGMLDGKALYAASLGEWGRGVQVPHPIRHLLVYAGHSAAQLGRLVRRMHVLGELRHAALLDYDPHPGDELASSEAPGAGGKGSLRDASREIRALGQRLTLKTGDITRAGTPMASLQGIVADLAGISQDVDGGLSYRVEQSRYYAHEFQAAVRHLRIVRVGDWQPYDDFVQRYILHLFARIDRIGNRYESLGRRVDRLLFVKQAELLDSYTKSVNRTVREIDSATRALNASALEQIKASEKQVSLLEDAELFAAVFLIYYVGSVLYHFVEPAEGTHGAGGDLFLYGWAGLIGLLGGPLFVVVMIRWIAGKVRKWRRKPVPPIDGPHQQLLPLANPEREEP